MKKAFTEKHSIKFVIKNVAFICSHDDPKTTLIANHCSWIADALDKVKQDYTNDKNGTKSLTRRISNIN